MGGTTFSDGAKPFAEVYNTVYDVQLISRNGKEAHRQVLSERAGYAYQSLSATDRGTVSRC